MAVVRLQASHQRDSLLPEDVATNTWHCSTADNNPANVIVHAQEFRDAVGDFYLAINSFISDLYTGVIDYRAYNLADAEPRVPIFIGADAFTAPASANFPGEVALTLSFQAASASGVNQARRRNRVYLPIGGGNTTVANGDRRPGTLMLDTVETAAQALLDASNAAANWTWQVYSPTSRGAGGVEAGIFPVDNGWIDNSFDTIRSRGVKPTARRIFE